MLSSPIKIRIFPSVLNGKINCLIVNTFSLKMKLKEVFYLTHKCLDVYSTYKVIVLFVEDDNKLVPFLLFAVFTFVSIVTQHVSMYVLFLSIQNVVLFIIIIILKTLRPSRILHMDQIGPGKWSWKNRGADKSMSFLSNSRMINFLLLGRQYFDYIMSKSNFLY